MIKGTKFYVLILIFITVFSAFILYLPFLLNTSNFLGIKLHQNQGMDTVYGMWDSPQYLIVANTFYDPDPQNLYYQSYRYINNPIYFSEKLPGYPLMIRLFGLIFGQITSLVLVNIFCTVLGSIFLFLTLRRQKQSLEDSFWNVLFFLFFIPRAFMYKYLPASEPLATLGIIGGLYFYQINRPILSGLFLSILVITRPNGFLIIPALIVCIITGLLIKKIRSYLPLDRLLKLSLFPVLSFTLLITVYSIRLGDPLIFLKTKLVDPSIPITESKIIFPNLDFYGLGSGDINLFFFIAVSGLFLLISQKEFIWAAISSIFVFSTMFLGNDVIRFLVPISPLLINIGWKNILKSWPLRIGLLFIIFLNFKYTWITFTHPGYQAPMFDGVKSLITFFGL